MKSILLTTVAVAIIGGGILYGERLAKDKPRDDGRVVITYWEKWSAFEKEAMEAVVNEFNDSQEKIFVKFVSVAGISNKITLATAGGVPPDVAGLFGGNLAQYAYHESVMPLDELAAESGISPDDYIPVYYDMCTYRGKLWALPSTPASTALHFNKAILREVGWDPENPPKTIEELDKLDKLAAIKNGDKMERMGFLPTEPGWWPFAWGPLFGGQLWNGYDKLTLTDPDVIRGYEWFGSYAEKYGSGTVQSFKEGLGTFNSPQNAFMDGRVATVMQGVWMANFIEMNNKDLEWAAAPFPTPADRPDLVNPTIIDLDILVIPRGAKHPKEAFEFIKFVQSQKGMELLCMGQKKNSPLKKVSKEFIENHPNPYVQLFTDLAYSPNVIVPPKTPIWPQLSQEIRTATEKINGGTDPKEALQDVQNKMQPLLDDIVKYEKARGVLTEEEIAKAKAGGKP
ncbi:MAG: ABC transporter substrate-binding protein [Armatimonadetes bacterium]|nr:ABC transporter substrate-binding protein [Armatimonadota bacterium]